MASSNLSHCGRVVSRRSFIERTFGVAGAAAVSQLSVARGAHVHGKEQIRVALIGAGDRGTGAAFNVLLSNRTQPTAEGVEVGHYASIPGHLMNISWKVGRQIHWGSAKEAIVADPEANALLTKAYRAPWKLEV